MLVCSTLDQCLIVCSVEATYDKFTLRYFEGNICSLPSIDIAPPVVITNLTDLSEVELSFFYLLTIRDDFGNSFGKSSLIAQLESLWRNL